MDRRAFIKTGGMLLAGATSAFGLPLLAATNSSIANPTGSSARRKWGMVIDLNRCLSECSACLEACRKENNVAFHGDKRWDIHWIRKVRIRRKHSAGSTEKSVILLCNHCENPPCVQVCTVKASYKRDDGIVIVDHHRCIGCRYCVIACPYNARYFNFKENREWHNKNYPKRMHGVAESCHFCAHLVDKGKKPACVDACERINIKALVFGNLNDPASDISLLMAGNPTRGIREDLGTKPKVHYIGL